MGRRPKKNTGNKNPDLKPVRESGKPVNDAAEVASGHPESKGGSRQGNIGHTHSENVKR